MSSTSGSLSIATRHEGLIGVGSGWGGSVSATHDSLSRVTCLGGGSGGRSQAEPAFVGRLPKYPGVIFIRSGTSWVGAFYEGGEWLSCADRGESPSGAANPRSR